MANKKPRISINQLAEYCEASSSRRKKIVQNAKDPKPYMVTWYSEARKAIKDFFIAEDDRVLSEAIDHIGDLPNESDFQTSNNALSIEALEIMLDCEFTKLAEFSFKEFDQDNTLIEIAGVDISVNPDLILTKDDQVGALKIHIKKDGLSTESLKRVAVVLHQYVKDYVAGDDQTANSKMCFSFDVFSEQIVCSPSSFKRRMQEIEDACSEIALWWESL